VREGDCTAAQGPEEADRSPDQRLRRLEDAARTERDKLVFRTLADTGLRLSELLGMSVQDVEQDSRGWSLRVMGKGARERES